MPNWCSNWTHFRHSDKLEVERLKAAGEAGNLFAEFVPNPAGEDSEDWYAHNTTEWGTKWDAGIQSDNPIEFDSGDNLYTLSASFDTAWSPPLAFYEHLQNQGWQIDAYYFESGMNFCGKWSDGFDDYYDIPETAEEAADLLPEDLEEVFDICQMLHDREEENENEDEDDA